MQILVMIVQKEVFLVVTFVYDGLFKGGIYVIMAEITAEVGYPVGESITYGFLNALDYGMTWII
jgi:hypothetical protein